MLYHVPSIHYTEIDSRIVQLCKIFGKLEDLNEPSRIFLPFSQTFGHFGITRKLVIFFS